MDARGPAGRNYLLAQQCQFGNTYQKLQCSKEFAKSKGDNDLHNKLSTIWPVKGLLLNRIKTHEVHWAQKTSYRQEH